MQSPEYDYENPVEGALFDKEHELMITSDHRYWKAISQTAKLAHGHLWTAVHEPATGKDAWVEITSEVRITGHEIWIPITGSHFMYAEDDELASSEPNLNDLIDEDVLAWTAPKERKRLQAMKDDFNDPTRPMDSSQYFNNEK